MSGSLAPEGPEEVFDPAAALARLDGDLELLQEVAAILLDEWSRESAVIESGFLAGDAAAIATAAHALKGAVGQLSDEALAAEFSELERSARALNLQAAEEIWRQSLGKAASFVAAVSRWGGGKSGGAPPE